ncbi:peptide MFS transporter [Metabacillus sp. GX 13764]|uniref:peptide MFS transporter n=1 Tax=Metabacillus kandeliae TaxID=2900151 RepID=UPI001E40AAF0|nr:peptide MFS transporter [Metabacillus kandeliae]MCD7033841.1 peptide MFS transporter [Metabacillus kandeliae]
MGKKEPFPNESAVDRGFFGHPKGLFTLFFTEFWERFSYYGMKAILVYYMYTEVTKGGLGIDQSTATAIVSIYGSLVYMSGIIGGWIADRLAGSTRTVFLGGVLIMLGHIALALPVGLTGLFASMVLIVLGTGLLKPNVSNVVGSLYSKTDNRRDSGFSIFYMGVNLGAFVAPLVVGTVGQKYNYHLGFGLAAIGMFLGLIVFMATKKKNIGNAGNEVPNPLPEHLKGKIYAGIGAAGAVLIVLGVIFSYAGILTIDSFINLVTILSIFIPIAYFVVMYRSSKTTPVEKSRLLAYIPLFIASVIFWAIQEQGSTILAVIADKRTELNFLGLKIESSWFQSVNPLFIIVLAPVFAWLWMKLGDRQPSTPRKFSLGLIFAGLSFLVLLVPAIVNGTDTLFNPLWLVLSFLLCVIGELCLSPVGLSATTKLAPAAFSAQTMSLWFLSNAAAQGINAQIVQLYTFDNEVMYFTIIGLIALALGLILFAVSPAIKKLMQGIQ